MARSTGAAAVAGWRVQPLDATFGAVVEGIDLRRLDAVALVELHRLWLDHALLVFPGQHLSPAQQVRFARHFGDLEFDLAPLSNLRRDGSLRRDDPADDVLNILKGNMGWHSDSTYMPLQAKGAVFSAHIVPPGGGETGWADMRAAYDALDPQRRAFIADRSASHSLRYSQAKLGHEHRDGSDYSGYGFHDGPVPRRPLVKVHPETGRPALLIGRHAYDVTGLSEADSAALLEELLDFACRPPRSYEHRWQPGDVVLWDNRCLLHRARPWDLNEPRLMYHSRIAGEPASEAGLGTSAG